LSAYDDELKKDKQVVAATPFLTNPNDAKWASFDVAEWLLRQEAEKHDQIPPVPPEPPEPPCQCEVLVERVARLEMIVQELCYHGADIAEGVSEWLDSLGRQLGARG